MPSPFVNPCKNATCMCGFIFVSNHNNGKFVRRCTKCGAKVFTVAKPPSFAILEDIIPEQKSVFSEHLAYIREALKCYDDYERVSWEVLPCSDKDLLKGGILGVVKKGYTKHRSEPYLTGNIDPILSYHVRLNTRHAKKLFFYTKHTV